MRRIAHLSDLHFGREDPAVAEALAADLARQRVDLVLVSGDLTQRARRRQFKAARAWLDSLPAEWIAVPGNHDIPLFDLPRRLLDPYGRYRRHIEPVLDPSYQDDKIAVLGLNTVLPRVWKGGLVRRHALRRLRAWSQKAGPRARIVIAHHPFTHHGPGSKGLVRGWREAVAAMEAARVDLLLTGHLHRFRHSESRDFAVDGPHRLVVVGASTSISHRRRGEPNQYSIVAIDAAELRVEARLHEGRGFVAGPKHSYRRVRGLHPERPLAPVAADSTGS